MKYKVIGKVNKNNERTIVQYGDDFTDYTEAYDYKEWLENPNNWKGNLKDKPYMIYIEEEEMESDEYFNDAMNNEE